MSDKIASEQSGSLPTLLQALAKMLINSPRVAPMPRGREDAAQWRDRAGRHFRTALKDFNLPMGATVKIKLDSRKSHQWVGTLTLECGGQASQFGQLFVQPSQVQADTHREAVLKFSALCVDKPNSSSPARLEPHQMVQDGEAAELWHLLCYACELWDVSPPSHRKIFAPTVKRLGNSIKIYRAGPIVSELHHPDGSWTPPPRYLQ